MANWYASLGAVKRAVGIDGSDRDSVISSHISAVSRDIDGMTNRRFIPITKILYLPWPTRDGRAAWWIPLPQDVLSVSALTKEGDDVTAIANTDYFLEPVNLGPPYHRIEIDLESTAFFSSKGTHQRQIQATCSVGYGNDTAAAGTLISGTAASTTATALVWSDASLAGVGDTLLIDDEQMFVTAKTTLDTACNTNGALTATKNQTTVTVTDGTKVKASEIILINSERMYVESVTGNDLAVKRGYDGTVLAAHDTATDVYAFRTLTVVRAVNGTTGAFHANTTAATKYAPPADIVEYCIAETVSRGKAELGGWTGTVGSGEGAINITQRGLNKMRDDVKKRYRRHVIGAV